MDGFFVAKIQKLSDRHPEDNNEVISNENEVENEIGPEEVVDVDWMNEVKKITSKKTKEQSFRSNTVETNEPKQGNASKSQTEEKYEIKKRKISVPPKPQNNQKKRQNASVTKPRRRKPENSMNM
jgi:exopolysaccharide biosynthesis protein